jgi:predicted nucleic acid-binding protein
MDACAMIALLKNEKGADIVSSVYKNAKDGNAKIIMNRINLLEVYYGFYHADGKDYADKILSGIMQSVISITEFDDVLFPIAGRLKASYKISLADSIALAQAIVINGELITSDHHEFDVIENKESIVFRWIR